MSYYKNNIYGSIIGLISGLIAFWLAFFILLPQIGFSVPVFKTDWALFFLPVIVPVCVGWNFGEEYSIAEYNRETFRFIGMMLVALLITQVANFLLGLAIGLVLVIVSATFGDILMSSILLGIFTPATIWIILLI